MRSSIVALKVSVGCLALVACGTQDKNHDDGAGGQLASAGRASDAGHAGADASSGGSTGGSPVHDAGGANSGGTANGSAGGAGAPANAGSGGSVDGFGAPIPVRLRTELQRNPMQVQAASPRLSWELQSTNPAARAEVQTGYELLVASSAEQLSRDEGDLQASGVVVSSESRTAFRGTPLPALAQAFWKVRVRDGAGHLSAWSEPAQWTAGLSTPGDWGAQWISAGDAIPLPLYRRELSVDKPLKRALVSICGLGQFELRINGRNASDAVLEPGWTNYDKSCEYVSYDVTALLAPGKNAVGVLLGNGMYKVVQNSRYTKFSRSFGPLKLIARLDISFTDGTKTALVSDANWKVAPSPIVFSNTYGGEDFDARKEPTGWDQPGFSDANWQSAKPLTGAAPALVGRAAPPIRVMQHFTPVKISQPRPGVYVYDLGHNFSGWPNITVQGDTGTSVRMTPGELLNADGTVSQVSSGSPVWFTYTLKGGGVENWHPRFSYYGFRYVQVEGAVPQSEMAKPPGKPVVTALSGEFIHADPEQLGKFSSSDADLNAIHALILAAFQSNLQSVLTDCPHREKLGWLETSHLLGRSIAFNYDVAGFYEKVISDIRDAQGSDGLVPSIAPEFPVFSGGFRDSPEWGSALVLNPWLVFEMYGERRALEDSYASMKRYVTYLQSKASGNIVAYGLGDWYDVGPGAPGTSQLTTSGLTATAIWLQDLQVLRQVALLLGKASDASDFAATMNGVTKSFNARFLTATGSYDKGSQTANAMPLALGLVPADRQPQILDQLVLAVKTKNQVTAGDIGFGYVVRALTEANRADVLYDLVKQSSGPGYLYQLSHGATTLTEAWSADPKSSQNHAMLGDAEEWLYRGLAGINPDPSAPGFKKFVIAPQAPPKLASVTAEYHSASGLITSSWERTGAGLTLKVGVPVNTTASVYVPTAMPALVTEQGKPATAAAGVLASSPMTGALRLELGSGNYVFTASP